MDTRTVAGQVSSSTGTTAAAEHRLTSTTKGILVLITEQQTRRRTAKSMCWHQPTESHTGFQAAFTIHFGLITEMATQHITSTSHKGLQPTGRLSIGAKSSGSPGMREHLEVRTCTWKFTSTESPLTLTAG